MTTTHSIGEILSAGAIPSAEEAAHLHAIGEFVASHFGRFVGLSRGDFIRQRAWEPKWLSAMTGMRWSIGMGLGSDFLDFSRHAFAQLLAPGYDAFAADRALVDPYDEDVSVGIASESAGLGVGPGAFVASEGLFGVSRATRASQVRRGGLASTSGARARSLKQPGASRVVWADGAFADLSVLRALVSQGVFLADQVAGVESLVGANAKEAGRRSDQARPSISPASADKRALSLDGMRIDDRTPGLASALRVADRARIRSSQSVTMSALGAEPAFAPPRVYGFFDAVSGAFVNVESADSVWSGAGGRSSSNPSGFQPTPLDRGVGAKSLASGTRVLPGGAEAAALSSIAASRAFESESRRGAERVAGALGNQFLSRGRLVRPSDGEVETGGVGGRRREAPRTSPRSAPVELSLMDVVREVRSPEGAFRVFSGFESDRHGSSAGGSAGRDRVLNSGRLAGFAEATSHLPNGDVVARVERAQMASPMVRLQLARPSAMGLSQKDEESSRPRGRVPVTVNELVSALAGRRSVSGRDLPVSGGDPTEGPRSSTKAYAEPGTGPLTWAPWTAVVGLDGGRPLPLGRVLSVPEINGGSLFLKAMDGDLRTRSSEDFRPLVAGGAGVATNAAGWERALDGWTWIALADDTQSVGVASSSRNLLATLARGVQVPASLALAASTRARDTRVGAAERSTVRANRPAGVAVARGAAPGGEMLASVVDERTVSPGVAFGRRVVDFVAARTGVLGELRGTRGEALLPSHAASGRRGANVPLEESVAGRPFASALGLRAVVGSGVEKAGVGRLGFEQLLLVAAAQLAEGGDQDSVLRETVRGGAVGRRSDAAKGDGALGAELMGVNIEGGGPGRTVARGARDGIASVISAGHRVMRGFEAVGLRAGTAAKYPHAELFWRALGSFNAPGIREAAGGWVSFPEGVGLDETLSRSESLVVPDGRATSASGGIVEGGQWKSTRRPTSQLGVDRTSGSDSEVEGQQAYASYGARTLEWVLSGADVAEPEPVAAARGVLASAVVRQMVERAGVAGLLGGRAQLRVEEERALGAAGDAIRIVLERPVMTPREGRLLGGVLGVDGPVARVVTRLVASEKRGSLEPSLAAFIGGRGEEMARGGVVRDWGGHGSPIALLGGISRLGGEARGLVGSALSSAGWSSSTLELLDLADGVAAPGNVEFGGKRRDRAVARTFLAASTAALDGGLSVRSGDLGDSPGRGAGAAPDARRLRQDDGRGVRVEKAAAWDSGGFDGVVAGVEAPGGYGWSSAGVARDKALRNLARVIAGAESIGGRVDRDIGARTAEVSARLMAPAQLGLLETADEGYFGANAPSVARGANRSALRTAGRLTSELSDLVQVAVAGVDVLDLERARKGDNERAVSARAAAGHRMLSVAKALSQLDVGNRSPRSRFDAAGVSSERVLSLGGASGTLVSGSAGLGRGRQNEGLLGADAAAGPVSGRAARKALDASSSGAPFVAPYERAGGERGEAERAKWLDEAVGGLVSAPFDISEVLSSALGLSGLSGRLARALSSSTEGPGGARRLLRPLGIVAPDRNDMTARGGRDLPGWRGTADSVESGFGGSAVWGGRVAAVAGEAVPGWAGMDREFVQAHTDGDAREFGASGRGRAIGVQAIANEKRGSPSESLPTGRGGNIRSVGLADAAGSVLQTSPGFAANFWGPAQLIATSLKPAGGKRGGGREWSKDATFAFLEGSDVRPGVRRDTAERSGIAPWRAAAVAEEAKRVGSARLETVLAPEAMLGGMRSFGVSAAMAALRSRVGLVGQDGVGVLATLADSGIDLAAARSSLSAAGSVRRAGSVEHFGQLRGPQGARIEVRWVRGEGEASVHGQAGEVSDRGARSAFEYAGLSDAGFEHGAGASSGEARGASERASGAGERRRVRVSRGQATFGRFDAPEVGEMVAGSDGVAARRFGAHEIIERGGGGARAQRAGLLSAILRGAERSEIASVIDSFGLAEFARAWSGRVDGSRAGVVGGRASPPIGDRGAVSGARTESSPLRGASLVETAPSRATGGVGAGGGRASTSEAVRRTDWRFVETGSRASTAHADLGRLAAAIVSSSEAPSRVPMPLVAPAAKAVAQTALRAARSDANTQSRSASAGRGGDGGSGAPAKGGGSVQLSEKAIEMLAVEMASRVARLMGMMKERVGIW